MKIIKYIGMVVAVMVTMAWQQVARAGGCQGTVPSNADRCSTSESFLQFEFVNITLVSSCSFSNKCEYTCNSGYTAQNGSCVANSGGGGNLCWNGAINWLEECDNGVFNNDPVFVNGVVCTDGCKNANQSSANGWDLSLFNYAASLWVNCGSWCCYSTSVGTSLSCNNGNLGISNPNVWSPSVGGGCTVLGITSPNACNTTPSCTPDCAGTCDNDPSNDATDYNGAAAGCGSRNLTTAIKPPYQMHLFVFKMLMDLGDLCLCGHPSCNFYTFKFLKLSIPFSVVTMSSSPS